MWVEMEKTFHFGAFQMQIIWIFFSLSRSQKVPFEFRLPSISSSGSINNKVWFSKVPAAVQMRTNDRSKKNRQLRYCGNTETIKKVVNVNFHAIGKLPFNYKSIFNYFELNAELSDFFSSFIFGGCCASSRGRKLLNEHQASEQIIAICSDNAW